MLEFNPYFRSSAIELIRHRWFDDIRNKRVEKGAPFQIHLKCDQMDSYDYTNFQDCFAKTRHDYIDLIKIEIHKLKRH